MYEKEMIELMKTQNATLEKIQGFWNIMYKNESARLIMRIDRMEKQIAALTSQLKSFKDNLKDLDGR